MLCSFSNAKLVHYMQNLLNIFMFFIWYFFTRFQSLFFKWYRMRFTRVTINELHTVQMYYKWFTKSYSACSILVANIISLRSCWRFPTSGIVFPYLRIFFEGKCFQWFCTNCCSFLSIFQCQQWFCQILFAFSWTMLMSLYI